MKKLTLILIVAAFLGSLNVMADEKKEIKKTFDAKENLTVKLASSDCEITKGDDNKINVRIEYTYNDDCFEVDFNDSGNTLEIEEDFEGHCSGEAHFYITVPAATYVSFSSASGDFSLDGTKKGAKVSVASGDCKVTNVEGDVDMNAASGDMDARNIGGNVDLNAASGDIDVSSISGMVDVNAASGNITIKDVANGLEASAASGDIDIENLSGECKVSTASGDIEATNLDGNIKMKAASGNISLDKAIGRLVIKAASGDISAQDVVITEVSELVAASGDVELSLKESLAHDLTLSAASGNVTLDYNGNEVKGYFEFSAREDKGKIVSPFKFDKEEKEERHGKTYDVKSFTKGGSTPVVYLKTSSGTAELIK